MFSISIPPPPPTSPLSISKVINQLKLNDESQEIFLIKCQSSSQNLFNRQFSYDDLCSSISEVYESDVGHNLLFNYCNLLLLVFLCKKLILGLGDLFPCF